MSVDVGPTEGQGRIRNPGSAESGTAGLTDIANRSKKEAKEA